MGLRGLALRQSLKTTMLLNTCLSPMTYMLFSPADKAHNNIVFVCKSHYVDCLIKELGIDNSFGNPTYARQHVRKRKSWAIIYPKMKNQKLARSLNFTFRQIYDVISLTNYMSGDFVGRIYPIELGIKTYTDTDTDTDRLAS